MPSPKSCDVAIPDGPLANCTRHQPSGTIFSPDVLSPLLRCMAMPLSGDDDRLPQVRPPEKQHRARTGADDAGRRQQYLGWRDGGRLLDKCAQGSALWSQAGDEGKADQSQPYPRDEAMMPTDHDECAFPIEEALYLSVVVEGFEEQEQRQGIEMP